MSDVLLDFRLAKIPGLQEAVRLLDLPFPHDAETDALLADARDLVTMLRRADISSQHERVLANYLQTVLRLAANHARTAQLTEQISEPSSRDGDSE